MTKCENSTTQEFETIYGSNGDWGIESAYNGKCMKYDGDGAEPSPVTCTDKVDNDDL